MKRAFTVALLVLILALAAVAQSAQHGIQLTWTASASAGSTYNVYGSLTSGGPYVKLTPSPISALTFLDTTATDGKPHFYVVTAVAGGIESANSVQATVTALNVPNPPTALTATAQ
jgi:cellulose 1,4-beta-cellobiosidase